LNTVISFIIIFGALVFFHELGHFIFAKRAGILVREFAIGFGPKIFSYKKGETIYTIRLLPIGGFVRMAGEDPDIPEIKPGHRIAILFDQSEKVNKIIINGKNRYPNAKMIEVAKSDLEHRLFIQGYEEGDEDHLQTFPVSREAVVVEDQVETQVAPWDRQFASKKLSARAMTIFAGPLFNFILAIVAFTMIGIIQGVPLEEAKLGKVLSDSAAQEAGLKQGDQVLSIDGSEVNTFTDMTTIVRAHPEEELVFTVERDGQTMDIPVTPKRFVEDEGEIGLIGVQSYLDKSFSKVALSGFIETYHWTIKLYNYLGN